MLLPGLWGERWWHPELPFVFLWFFPVFWAGVGLSGVYLGEVGALQTFGTSTGGFLSCLLSSLVLPSASVFLGTAFGVYPEFIWGRWRSCKPEHFWSCEC